MDAVSRVSLSNAIFKCSNMAFASSVLDFVLKQKGSTASPKLPMELMSTDTPVSVPSV